MKTQVISATHPEAIALACEVIRSGGLIAFPTDTLYGLGCDPHLPTALQKIYAAIHNQVDYAVELSQHALGVLGVFVVREVGAGDCKRPGLIEQGERNGMIRHAHSQPGIRRQIWG